MTFGAEIFLDGVVQTTRRATIRWGGEARDDIFGHEPDFVARCCSPAKLLPGFSKFVGVPRRDDPRRNHPCCWHSQGGPAAIASCRTSKQLRRIGDRNDRRPSGLPQGPPSFGGLLDASIPAFGKARRFAVMTNLTLIYATLC